MPTGVYNLTVTNPDLQSDTLLNAFTVLETDDPNTTLESSFLVLFGPDNNLSAGDNDHVQLIFFDIPNTVTTPLYIRVFDPDTGGALDRAISSIPTFDTTVQYSVYGGAGAYTNPAAQMAQPPIAGIQSGTQLDTATVGEDTNLDQAWLTFGPFTPAEAELVGNRRLFKLAVVAQSGNDGNIYNAVLSTQPDSNIPLPGSRTLAFSWTFTLTDSKRPGLYPFLDATVTSFSQNNCDFDYSSGAILLRTPEQELSILNNISGDAVCLSSSIIPSNGETNSSWAVDFTQLVFTESGNDVTFWATNQSNSALPIFSSPTVFAAP